MRNEARRIDEGVQFEDLYGLSLDALKRAAALAATVASAVLTEAKSVIHSAVSKKLHTA
jgi:hypothetical protein